MDKKVGGLGGVIGLLTEAWTWFVNGMSQINFGDVLQASANAAFGTIVALIIGAVFKVSIIPWFFPSLDNRKQKEESSLSKETKK